MADTDVQPNETKTRSVTAGGGGSEMGQSKDGTASDLTSVFEAAEHSENTTGTEGHMSAADTQVRCDTEGEPPEQGVCGLRNLGNTCYMNAGLQSLCAVRQFCSAFLEMPILPSLPEKDEKPPRKWFHTELFAHLCTLIRKSWSGQYSALYPKALKLILGEIYSPFASSRQQDCQEFLAIVLDSLHENELVRMSQAIEQGAEPMEIEQQQEEEDGAGSVAESSVSFVTDTFQGTLKNEVLCLTCSFVSVKREPFMYLSLPIPHALEEQLVLTWSAPKLNCKPTNVLVTALQHQTFGQVKSSLLEALQLLVEKGEVVIAEVVNHRINRVLGDDFSVRLRDRKCHLYALHVPKGEAPGDQEGVSPAVVVQWHTCVVCLEEKEDSELMVHPKCDGKVCRPCLKEALAHNPVCVVCQDPVDEEKDIVPMATDSGNKPVSTRLLQANVLFRRKVESSDSLSLQLFGTPAILHFPTPTEGNTLHKMAAEVIPHHLQGRPYSLNVAGFMGRYCSRCEFGSKCAGCAIPNDEEVFSLKPGDYVVVTMESITEQDMAEVNAAEDHVSMKGRRDNQVTLEDCVELFSKEETLGGENPWYCPQCKEECLAKRTLTVQALPKVLMVHLKRFFYQDNFSTKVDTKVHLPLVLEGKCFGDDSTKLTLSSCVCHRGSLSCGHYTSYMCHPNSKKWYFCNDETITERSPDTIDGEEVYILFYQQQGADEVGVDFASGADFSWDQEVEKAVVAWLDPPAPSVPYGPHLPRSSSDTQLASAAVKPSSSTFSVDDSGLNIRNVGHTPLTRKSLEDVSDNVVLKSFKVNGVEIYRAAEV